MNSSYPEQVTTLFRNIYHRLSIQFTLLIYLIVTLLFSYTEVQPLWGPIGLFFWYR